MKKSKHRPPRKQRRPSAFRFRLYVAGDAPNSIKARSNLDQICKEYLQDRYQIELIDVLQNPERALEDGILVTPTLVKVGPGPSSTMIGNLSETPRVLSALGVNA